MKGSVYLLLLLISTKVHSICVNSGQVLNCNELVDGDLPLDPTVFSGNFDYIYISNTNLTFLPANSFGDRVSFKSLYIGFNLHLTGLDEDFIQANGDGVKEINISSAPKLRYITMR